MFPKLKIYKEIYIKNAVVNAKIIRPRAGHSRPRPAWALEEC